MDDDKKTSSRWLPVMARIGAVAVVLVVLAAIGHFAATRAAGLAATSAIDAGELHASLPPVASSEPADAGHAPPPLVLPTANAPVVTSTRATSEDPVYVNYASAEELRRLPGVGAKRAEAIVALRGRMGRFQRVEDLLRVKGIGRATIKKLRPLIRLGEPRVADAGAS